MVLTKSHLYLSSSVRHSPDNRLTPNDPSSPAYSRLLTSNLSNVQDLQFFRRVLQLETLGSNAPARPAATMSPQHSSMSCSERQSGTPITSTVTMKLERCDAESELHREQLLADGGSTTRGGTGVVATAVATSIGFGITGGYTYMLSQLRDTRSQSSLPAALELLLSFLTQMSFEPTVPVVPQTMQSNAVRAFIGMARVP